MGVAYSLSIAFQSLQPFIIATLITFLSLIVSARSFKSPHKSNASAPSTSPCEDEIKGAAPSSSRNCSCSGNGNSDSSAFVFAVGGAPAKEGLVTANASNAVAERQNGVSMMEQLVPEITTRAQLLGLSEPLPALHD